MNEWMNINMTAFFCKALRSCSTQSVPAMPLVFLLFLRKLIDTKWSKDFHCVPIVPYEALQYEVKQRCSVCSLSEAAQYEVKQWCSLCSYWSLRSCLARSEPAMSLDLLWILSELWETILSVRLLCIRPVQNFGEELIEVSMFSYMFLNFLVFILLSLKDRIWCSLPISRKILVTKRVSEKPLTGPQFCQNKTSKLWK